MRVRGGLGPRVAVTAVVVVIVMLDAAGPARAEKKKPGLFDFDTWKTPAARERDAAKQLAPGQLDLSADRAPTEPLRAVQLRFYADRDYRMIVLRWQRRLRAQIERINAVSGPVFGVRFEIESLREWDRSHTGASPDALLADLQALDPARDVDWVIGLVTPLHGVATSIHQIGVAGLLARHFVMRGMDDEQEILALEREWKLLTPDERQGLYGDRKSHKEVVIFLHEWGHTLGLLHHESPSAIMNPSYDPRQAAFTPFEKRVVSLVVQHRLAGRKDDLYPENVDLEPLLADCPDDEGSDKDRAQLLDLVRRRARDGAGGAGAESGGMPGGTRPPGVGAADIDTFNHAVGAANAGRTEPAWSLLAPLAQRLAGANKPPDAAFALRVAQLAANLGALSVAETLLGRPGGNQGDPETEKLAAQIESTRHRIALPAGAAALGVPPDREPSFIAGYEETSRLVAGADRAAARARLAVLATAFPDAPGVDVLACDLERQSGKRAAAARRCEAALAKFDGATRAMVLLGVMAAEARRDTVAEKYLRRAILLDPGDPGPWRLLARLYRATRASQRLAELASQHQALLSAPLPED